MKRFCVPELLIYLGFPPDLKGFFYLEFVIEQMYDNPSIKLTEAYSAIVAKEQNVKSYSIDSLIRNVIHAAFDSKKLLNFNEVMGMNVIEPTVCPSNKSFIALLIRYLRTNDIAPKRCLGA